MPAIRMRVALPADDKKNATERAVTAGQDLTDLEPEVADKMVKAGLADYLDEKGNVTLDNDMQKEANAAEQKRRDEAAKSNKVATQRVQVVAPPVTPTPQDQPTTLGGAGATEKLDATSQPGAEPSKEQAKLNKQTSPKPSK